MRLKVLAGETITAVLSAAETSADCKVLVITSDNSSGLTSSWATTDGVTAVTLFTGVNPVAFLEGITLCNVDTGAITVTLKHVISGTGYTFAKVTLQVSDTLVIDAEGIRVIDVNGQIKTAAEANSVTTAAVTATTGGATTGLIPAGRNVFATVTSDSANKQITLPAGQVGDVIKILVGATGCELIASVAADKVNDVVVGATNEAALTAENLYTCQYVATNKWVVTGQTKLGAAQSALVPDAL